MPVLERVFPHRLEPHDPKNGSMLRLAYEERDAHPQHTRPQAAVQHAWIRFVLHHTLGLPDEVLVQGQAIAQTLKATIAEHGETLRPALVVRTPDGVPQAGKARLLIQT